MILPRFFVVFVYNTKLSVNHRQPIVPDCAKLGKQLQNPGRFSQGKFVHTNQENCDFQLFGKLKCHLDGYYCYTHKISISKNLWSLTVIIRLL